MNAIVKDVMTPKVITVKKDTPFEAIAAALHEYRVSAFPVLDETSKVIGVVSESDLLAKLALGMQDDATVPGMITGILRHQQLQKAHAITAAELMTTPAFSVLPEDTVETAARIMYLRNVKRLPVIDPDGHLAGIVSRADVLTVYSRTDAGIAEEIRTSILSTKAPADHGTFDVSVQAGVATIIGRPQSREQAHAIIGRARQVQGVVAVRDRLDHPDPAPDRFDVLAGFPTVHPVEGA
jgi:CBS domain-containing protein